MDMTNSMNTTLMRAMNTALHFKPLGDTLLFSSWMPASGGAVAGACIGLFILAMLERWVDAMRMLLGMRWAAAARTDAKAIKDKGNAGKKKRPVRLHAPPFVAAHDVPRGALYALQSLLGYVFMLVAMTFQVAYIMSLVAGFGVGEALFGSYGASGAGML